ncbi:phage tail assembly chaperone G [Clostridium tyrobutyricum]|uniref:phage tail assembly chaperone G n=1 Tax=Clostridium tyrobutyricum TaxID=1519 RepID=UPI001C39133B|nr:hypothetical protein [Clostridium tyrobutyricum]MBV4423155.1 hypothetical protein [Clostridium tyrobutyricum]MBV4424924.1 hypothetical protein [Clostridium tyrobutyricum]
MEKIKIKLNDKEYTMPKPKTKTIRNTLELLNQKVDFSHVPTEYLDEIVNYVCDVFGNQFNANDVYEGLDADKIMPKFKECSNSILDNIGLSLNNLPNEKTPEEVKE